MTKYVSPIPRRPMGEKMSHAKLVAELMSAVPDLDESDAVAIVDSLVTSCQKLVADDRKFKSLMISGPKIKLVEISQALKKAREAKNLTQEKVARETEWSLSKVARMEAGSFRPSPTDLNFLISLYGIPKAQAEKMRKMRRGE